MAAIRYGSAFAFAVCSACMALLDPDPDPDPDTDTDPDPDLPGQSVRLCGLRVRRLWERRDAAPTYVLFILNHEPHGAFRTVPIGVGVGIGIGVDRIHQDLLKILTL